MIQTFADKETKSAWDGTISRRFPREIQRTAKRKLVLLHSVLDLEELRIPPGNRLEKLSGSRDGQWSIRINDQWRICFRWSGHEAYNVEMTDYH